MLFGLGSGLLALETAWAFFFYFDLPSITVVLLLNSSASIILGIENLTFDPFSLSSNFLLIVSI